MLEDAAGIRRVVIACGYVDLRKDRWAVPPSSGGRYHQNPFEKELYFYSVADGPTASRDFYGWETVFFSSKRLEGRFPCPGLEPAKRPQTLQRNSSIIL